MTSYARPQKGKRDTNETPILKNVANPMGYLEFSEIARHDSAVGSFGFYIRLGKWDGCDSIFFDEHGCFFVEFKMPGEGYTPNEKVMLLMCAALGLLYYTVYSYDDMRKVLNERRK